MKKFIEKHFINLAIVIVFVLILIGASLSFYNKTIMKSALQLQEQAELLKRETSGLFGNVQNMDISGRGYALMHGDEFLFLSPESAKEVNRTNFNRLDSLLQVYGYSDHETYNAVKAGFDSYVIMYDKMVKHLKNDELDAYKALLAENRGGDLYALNAKFAGKLNAHLDQLNHQAQEAYAAADYRNTWLQILLLTIGLPTLAGVMYKMRKETKDRKGLLLKLEENNQKYLFNEGDGRVKSSMEILEGSIENLKKAAAFVNEITEGNYEAQWEQLNEQNKELNQQNLAGRLVLMREQMKRVKSEDEKRLWATEGLTKFSEVIRTSQHDLAELTFNSLKFLVKYLNAQQGSLFVLENDDQDQTWLQQAACFAFDRKKFINKRIEIGEGLVGQVYLEGETVYITDVPQSYTSITSGLGEATPRCILIVPMKYNDGVQAIIELASFRPYEAHQVALLEKAGEFIASAIATAQTNEKTNKLLAQLQIQTEQMRAHEEELRQNMEELEATQEEMRRKGLALEEQMMKASRGESVLSSVN